MSDKYQRAARSILYCQCIRVFGSPHDNGCQFAAMELHDLDDVAAEFGVDLSPGRCGGCGRMPAAGFASMWTREGGEVWLCHGDDDESPTCYEQASALSGAFSAALLQAMEQPFDSDIFRKGGRTP